MSLNDVVGNQVAKMGSTPGGCKLLLHDLLDNGRDVFQFMQLFNEKAIESFYYGHAGEIDRLCAEHAELPEGASIREGTKLALEKVLILIEAEMKSESYSQE